ncbi:hypothetical protein V8C86DRAFT_2678304 [Haematococcus lacustris]
MVKIPFVNIEVAEPRISNIVPGFIELVIHLCSRLLTVMSDTVFPLTDEAKALLTIEQMSQLAPEFNKVVKRDRDGRIKNDGQLSSELEEAAQDYYRRMLREDVVGFDGETHEQLMLRKLAWDNNYAAEHVLATHQYLDPPVTFDEMADELGIPPDEQSIAEAKKRRELEEEDANVEDVTQQVDTAPANGVSTRNQLHAIISQEAALVADYLLADQEEHIELLEQAVAGPRWQGFATTSNAGLGIALGVMTVRTMGFALRRVSKALRRMRKRAAAHRMSSVAARQQGRASKPDPTPAPAPVLAAPTAAPSAAAAAAAPAVGAGQTPQARGAARGTLAGQRASARPAAAAPSKEKSGQQGTGSQASQQQPQQQQQQQQQQPVRPTRPATRTR